jgi:hypothetical protein
MARESFSSCAVSLRKTFPVRVRVDLEAAFVDDAHLHLVTREAAGAGESVEPLLDEPRAVLRGQEERGTGAVDIAPEELLAGGHGERHVQQEHALVGLGVAQDEADPSLGPEAPHEPPAFVEIGKLRVVDDAQGPGRGGTRRACPEPSRRLGRT